MEKPTRRNLLKAAAVGGVTATGLGAVFGAQRGLAANAPEQNRGRGGKDDDEQEHKHEDDPNGPLSGKRALAVVSFGQWEVDPADPLGPVDRLGAVPPSRNVHKVLPFEAEVEQGGAVSFTISGLHQILIYQGYDDFDELHAAWVAAGSPLVLGGAPRLIEFAVGRVYRGIDPRILTYATPVTTPPTVLLNQDRAESVNFLNPGRYLVTCGVMPHFNDNMHGFVTVRERD